VHTAGERAEACSTVKKRKAVCATEEHAGQQPKSIHPVAEKEEEAADIIVILD
jgi:hypothetical protein